MNLDKSNWVTSTLDMVLNGITKEKNFPSRWVTFPPSSPESKLQGPFVRSPLYKTGEVPTKPCDLCALSSQCDLVAGGPQLQDRRTGCGKSKKAHWREGLSHPVCIWPGMDGWPPVPFQAAVLTLSGQRKAWLPNSQPLLPQLGRFPWRANVQPNLSFTCISLLHSCLPISLSLEVPSLSWELEHALFLPLSLPCLCVLIYSFKLGLNGYPASYEGDTRYIENDLLIFWMCLLLSSPSPPQTCPVWIQLFFPQVAFFPSSGNQFCNLYFFCHSLG